MINLVKSQENSPEMQLTNLMENYLKDNSLDTPEGPTNPFYINYFGYDFFMTYKLSQDKLLEDVQKYAHDKLEKLKIFALDTYNTPIKKLSSQLCTPSSKQEGVIRYICQSNVLINE